MSRSQIGKETLEEAVPAALRQQFEKDNISTDRLPRWDYITANTRYSAQGLHNNCQDIYGKTLHEHLRDQGFGARSSGRWPTDNQETVESLEYYISSLKDNQLADTTIDSVESAINKFYEAIQEENIDIEMIDLCYYTSEDERVKHIQYTIDIIKHMDNNLSAGTMINYTNYFSRYYEIIKNFRPSNHNPVDNALDEFSWIRPLSDAQPLTSEQLKDIWNTLNALNECPVQGYELDEWRLWMKMLIIFLIAVGPRSNEVVEFDIQEQLILGDDPHVVFRNRKNLRRNRGSQKVPVMTGIDHLRAYKSYIEEVGGNGKLVPSDESKSGCRTADTLNRWLKRVCEKAGVRLGDGTLPTMQNFRQTWTTLYKKTVHENREEINFVSGEKGTKNLEVDEENYIREVQNRKHMRELGRDYFNEVIKFGDLPQLLHKKLNSNQIDKNQTSLTNYNS